ncbi:methyltransferase domain-containing protein [Paraburkholderia fungorum]|uniref:methyltransferase domain-containing protein n=1 Tax=Paraburkholderia fungorum TaxID=134537 RepID=UPI0038B7C4FB
MKIQTIASQFGDVDAVPNSKEYIDYLDARANLPGEPEIRRRAMEMLDIRPGHHVLDTGCGSGNAILALAASTGPSGKIVGLDSSAVMIGEARKRFPASALPVEFVEGDVLDLPFLDASFDRVRADRLLLHVDDPVKGLSEMVRVLKPGGRIVVCEPASSTSFLDSCYPETARKILEWVGSLVCHRDVGGKLPRMFYEAGLREVRCMQQAIRIEWSFVEATFSTLQHNANVATLFTSSELDAFLDDMKKAQACGYFNFSLNIFVTSAWKP